MKLSTTLALSASFFFVANAVPVEQKSRGTKITLSKRNLLVSPGGNVNATLLRKHIAHSVAKIQKGFRAYANNVGEPHPYEFPTLVNEAIISTSTSVASLPVSTTIVDTTTSFVKRAPASPVALTNEGVSLWHGEIAVGSPPQKFRVDFDTGSSDLFLPSLSCDANCDGHQKYDPSQSSQSKDITRTFKLGYGDGSTVSGNQYQDTVSLAGLTAVNQTLGAATMYSEGFSKSSFAPDGLLGMAFQSISDYNAPSVFESLVNQGQADQSIFAFKLAQRDSELHIGGVNNALYKGDFTWTNVTKEGYWQVDLDAISNNSTQILADMSAIIDTGTTLIIGDSDAVDKIYSQIPGAQPAFDTQGEGMYTIPCSSIPDISFTFGGKVFPISQEALNYGTAEVEGRCVGSIVGNKDMSFWIVGDVFLRGVYTAFDFGGKRVGFAELV